MAFSRATMRYPRLCTSSEGTDVCLLAAFVFLPGAFAIGMRREVRCGALKLAGEDRALWVRKPFGGAQVYPW